MHMTPFYYFKINHHKSILKPNLSTKRNEISSWGVNELIRDMELNDMTIYISGILILLGAWQVFVQDGSLLVLIQHSRKNKCFTHVVPSSHNLKKLQGKVNPNHSYWHAPKETLACFFPSHTFFPLSLNLFSIR